MPLWSERQRLREQAEREAAGEDLWSSEFSITAKAQIAFVLEMTERRLNQEFSASFSAAQIRDVALMFLRRDGVDGPVTSDDLAARYEDTSDDTLNGLEAYMCALRSRVFLHPLAQEFEQRLNQVLLANRLAVKMIDGEFVPYSNDLIYTETVEPVLQLLASRRFSKAHAAFFKALRELQQGDAGDSITDAGTALQETLVALGCSGNALGPLIKDASRKGLLAAHDSPLTDAIEKVAHWASAERSTKGDAHTHSEATVDDAWMMVHVVGALIRRLAADTPRARKHSHEDPA